MPKSIHEYIIEGSSTVSCRWVPAVHPKIGNQMLLYHFDPPGDSARASQLQELQFTISSMDSPMLLGPFESDCSSQSPFFSVLHEGLVPLPHTEICQLPLEEIDRMVLNIARALCRLHQDGLLMGLLTPGNLLSRKPITSDSVMLSGFSHVVDTATPPQQQTFRYASPYTAPELLLYMMSPTSERAAHLKPVCDVFSLGIVYHELLTGDQPTFNLKPGSRYEHRDAPQISRKLDYPHRQLLRRMMRLSATERLSDMHAVEKEIMRLLKSSACMIQLQVPSLAGRKIFVRTDDITCTWKQLDANGCAAFGPLLADQAYVLICQGVVIGKISFPNTTSGQTITVDEKLLKKLPPMESQPAACTLSVLKVAEDTPQFPRSSKLDPALNELQESLDVMATRASLQVKLVDILKQKLKQTIVEFKSIKQPEPEKQSECALKNVPAQPMHSSVHVLERIVVNPPLNNIRLIEVISPEVCQLTLINHGTFRIRRMDAHRYGIAHLITKEGR